MRAFLMRRKLLVSLSIAAAAALSPAAAYAHGPAGPPPNGWTILTGWQFDPLFIIPTVLVTWLYIAGVQRVNRMYPRSPFPRRRTTYFMLGIGSLVLALASPIARYDTDLFFMHMIQHMLIIMFAAPLLLLGTPITLTLRAATPRVRREVLLPILHSRVVKAISFPVLAWFLLAVTMWLTHYSAVFNIALENVWVHQLEHTIYMVVALLFWWPVVAAEPSPWRFNHPVRMLYVFLQMPQNSFLAVSIYGSERVIFPHYATVARTWGPSPLLDQQYAGLIMWVGGDMSFLLACGFILYGWVKFEEREAKRIDLRLAREKAARVAKLTEQQQTKGATGVTPG